jgi:UDP-glucose 4-epimerase
MKSLVTGGAGFIGSHIVDRLVDLEHDIIVIDNESAGMSREFYHNKNAEYYKEDISEYDRIRPLFDDVDYVFHLAAESRIQTTISDPLKTIKTNSLGTAVVLQCSREAGVKKVIYSSTSSAYGLKNQSPLQEDMMDDCLNPYAASKISGEKYCKIYSDLYGLKTVIFRYFNVYGPREPVQGPYAPVLGLFLRQFKAGESLTIVPDGTQRRDFTHVDDVVEANLLAMTKEHDHYGEIFNVGSGINHSVLELAAMISDRTVFIDPRSGESYITLADNSKIRNILGWRPTKTVEEYIKEKLKN